MSQIFSLPDDSEKLEQKLSTARTQLILDKPFLGALVLRLPLVAADPKWCPTTATDARKLYYNPDYVRQLHPHELLFVLAHEALHCGLLHFARRGHRKQHLWDIACDYAVNPLLVDEGLTPPPSALMLREYEDMTAEEIYPLLGDLENDMNTMDKHLFDEGEGGQKGEGKNSGDSPEEKSPDNGGNQKDKSHPDQSEQDASQPKQQPQPDETKQAQDAKPKDARSGLAVQPEPLSEQEKQDLSQQWQQRLAGAAQQAMQAGKLGENWVRMVEHYLEPQLPWQALLARYMKANARDDYSWQRPNSRREGPALFPSLKNGQLDLVVAIDVSGSIQSESLAAFLSEINSIKSQINAKVSLLACDAKLSQGSPWIFEPWEFCHLPESLTGGGGTDFKPVFDWIDTQDTAPDMLIYFTDAIGSFPKHSHHYPVLWLIQGRAKVPFGQRVQLN